jgi:hypothetical protein
MPHDSSASAAPKDYCRLFEDISPSEDGSPGRAVRVLLPVFLAVAFFRASDVIRGMGRAPAGWTRVSRRRRRGVQSRSDTEKAWTDLVRLCRLLNTNRSRASRGRDCAASRRRGRPEVPRARGRVREHRRIVDPGQRLQPVRKTSRAGFTMGAGGRRGFGGYAAGPTLDPLVGWTMCRSRCGRSCSPSLRCGRNISHWSATSLTAGSTGTG